MKSLPHLPLFQWLTKATAALLLSLISMVGHAEPLLGTEPGPGVILPIDELEWVWAGRCLNGNSDTCAEILLHHGFEYATGAQFLESFINAAGLYDAFRQGPCAGAYFNSTVTGCDIGLLSDFIFWNTPFRASPARGEVFLVRGTSTSVAEPGNLGLLAIGSFVACLSARLRHSRRREDARR
jgi:hypothetical protein